MASDSWICSLVSLVSANLPEEAILLLMVVELVEVDYENLDEVFLNEDL